jgi:hypothetical protein
MAIATMLAELDYETKRHHLTVENVATNHSVPLELVLFVVAQLGKRHLVRVLATDVQGRRHHSVELVAGQLDVTIVIGSKGHPDRRGHC